jgi:hypothetical protein
MNFEEKVMRLINIKQYQDQFRFEFNPERSFPFASCTATECPYIYWREAG